MATLKDRWIGDTQGDAVPKAPLYKVLVVVLVYLVRTGLMNCTYPLEGDKAALPPPR